MQNTLCICISISCCYVRQVVRKVETSFGVVTGHHCAEGCIIFLKRYIMRQIRFFRLVTFLCIHQEINNYCYRQWPKVPGCSFQALFSVHLGTAFWTNSHLVFCSALPKSCSLRLAASNLSEKLSATRHSPFQKALKGSQTYKKKLLFLCPCHLSKLVAYMKIWGGMSTLHASISTLKRLRNSSLCRGIVRAHTGVLGLMAIARIHVLR